MVTPFRRIALLTCLTLSMASTAALAGDGFTAPSQEELKMTDEPGAPGSAATYLFRDERADDKLHIHTVYVRMKILTEKGKEYANVVIPYEGNHFVVRDIQGRTIHADGTVIPFTGKPFDQTVVKSATFRYKTKAFSMPDVQVGSIIEYKYVLGYDDDLLLSPRWFIQQDEYVRKAHYQFVPTEHYVQDEHENVVPAQLAYSSNMPKERQVQYQQLQKAYLLDVEKTPAQPNEEYMPPLESQSQRVFFYYTTVRTAAEYWKTEGKYWSKGTDKFINANALGPAVSATVAPSDTPRQKVEKIYNAIMAMENTRFTRDHDDAENKANGIKIKTAADIWTQKRGSDDELTMLFIGMVRAAGIPAYAARVVDRSKTIFNPGFLSRYQLDDDVAIVVLDGKEEYFDPGQRYCPFGQLHWKHGATGGLRQTANGTDLVNTRDNGYKSTQVGRFADLTMEPDGKVTGTVRIVMTGNEALMWRQRALSNDEQETKRQFERRIQGQVPAGIEVKADHFIGLTDYDKQLMMVLNVSGTMTTQVGKRLLLPSSFFEASSKPLFVHDKRELPVDLEYARQTQDRVTLHLPSEFSVESLPKDVQIPLPKNAVYQAATKQEPGVIHTERNFILANTLYSASEYPPLKEFYQKVNAHDLEQAVLQRAPVTTAAEKGGSN